ncbi:MAG: hypothetical protein ACR2FU_22870 [Streptosporangiaceae bacterium]
MSTRNGPGDRPLRGGQDERARPPEELLDNLRLRLSHLAGNHPSAPGAARGAGGDGRRRAEPADGDPGSAGDGDPAADCSAGDPLGGGWSGGERSGGWSGGERSGGDRPGGGEPDGGTGEEAAGEEAAGEAEAGPGDQDGESAGAGRGLGEAFGGLHSAIDLGPGTDEAGTGAGAGAGTGGGPGWAGEAIRSAVSVVAQGLGVLASMELPGRARSGDPYRPWFMAGEPGSPWWASGSF